MSKYSNMRDGFMVRHDVKVEITSEVIPVEGLDRQVGGISPADRRLKDLHKLQASLHTVSNAICNEIATLESLVNGSQTPWERAEEIERTLLDRAEANRLREKADQIDPLVDTGITDKPPQNGCDS